MKHNNLLLAYAASVVLVVMSCVLTASGGDDEKETGNGIRQVAELQALLLDGNGQVYFISTTRATTTPPTADG